MTVATNRGFRVAANSFHQRVAACSVLCVLLVSARGLGAQQTSGSLEPNESQTATPDLSAAQQEASAELEPSSGTYPISPESLTFADRLTIYERSFIRPENLIGPAFGAAMGQLRNTPREWGQGADGYGLRFASGYGRNVISRTIAFGVAAADHEDSRFMPSNEHGFWRRTEHAIVGTFVSRTPSGGTMPAVSRFAGAYGAAFIANAWEPRSQNSASDALARGSTALLSSVGWRVFEEFWPDIRAGLRHKHN